MPNPTPAEALEAAAASASWITVTDWNGRILTGIPKAHPTEPGVFQIRTGERGRPAQIHVDDAEEVTAE